MITTRPTSYASRATMERLRDKVIDHASRRESEAPEPAPMAEADRKAWLQTAQTRHALMSAGADYDTLPPYPARWTEPTPFIPETVDELRATVQGMRDQLTMSLNAIPSGHGNAISGMIEHKWRARRDALTEVLTMIDNVQATQKATQRRSWLKRMTDSLGMTSSL